MFCKYCKIKMEPVYNGDKKLDGEYGDKAELIGYECLVCGLYEKKKWKELSNATK